MRKFFKVLFVASATILIAGYLIPERKAMPCCTPADYNHNTFWYWPWTRGENGHPHTGVDIFGKVGAPVPYVWRAFGSAGTCNPPQRFNWRLMFWLNPADHLPKK